MEFFDLMSISHRYMEILNPSTSEKIIKLGKLLELKKGNRVIDFGCGCAEPLTLWAEEFGIIGIGIDISKDFYPRSTTLNVGSNNAQELRSNNMIYHQDLHHFL